MPTCPTPLNRPLSRPARTLTNSGESDEPSYRLLTTRLDPLRTPAAELAALYHERWEVESTCDEIKTHLLGRHPILRSKTPPLVRQEIEGLMLAHYAVRHFLHEAAREADEDPDRLSFIHAVHVIWRRVRNPGACPPAHRPRKLRQAVRNEILEERAESSRGQSKPRGRGVKRKMSNYRIRHRGPLSREVHAWEPQIVIHNSYVYSIGSRGCASALTSATATFPPRQRRDLPGSGSGLRHVPGFFDAAEPVGALPYRHVPCCLRPWRKPRHSEPRFFGAP